MKKLIILSLLSLILVSNSISGEIEIIPYDKPLILTDKPLRIEMERGEIKGKHIALSLDEGEKVVKLGLDGMISFDIEAEKDGYWQVKLRYGDLGIKDEFPRLQCMLNTQIIGLTEKDHPASGSYSSFKESVSVEEIGTILITRGKHRLWLKSCYTPVETIDYLEFIPLKKKVEEPIVTFVQITDTHINMTRKGPEILVQTLKDIDKYIHPDLIIETGDHCSGSWGREDWQKSFKKLVEDNVKVPHYYCQGNHDFGNSPKDFCRVFGVDNVCYSFDHNNVHFIVLGVDWYVMWAGNVREKDLAWLDEDLNYHKDMKTFIFLHPNLVRYPYNPQVAPRNSVSSTCSNASKVLKIMDKYPNIAGVFTGHIHGNFLRVRERVLHVITSSLKDYPVTYKAVRVYPEHLEMRSYQVSDEAFVHDAFINRVNVMGTSISPKTMEAVKNNVRGVIRNVGQVGSNCDLSYNLPIEKE